MAPPPREWVDHTPVELSLEELRVDWPAVPTGRVGLVNGVEEKLRWMARKLPHGYDTPEELAMRVRQGKLVRFENVEEKRLALKAANVRWKNFEGISHQDRVVLGKELIRGVYPGGRGAGAGGRGEGKEAAPFVDEVIRILGNNETYQAKQKDQLCATIQSFLSARRPAGTRSAAA